MSLVVQCELCGATYENRDSGTTLVAGYYAGVVLVDPDHPSYVAQVDCCPECADILGLPNNEHIDTGKAKEALVKILQECKLARMSMERKPLITIEQAVKIEEDMWSRGSPADDR